VYTWSNVKIASILTLLVQPAH